MIVAPLVSRFLVNGLVPGSRLNPVEVGFGNCFHPTADENVTEFITHQSVYRSPEGIEQYQKPNRVKGQFPSGREVGYFCKGEQGQDD